VHLRFDERFENDVNVVLKAKRELDVLGDALVLRVLFCVVLGSFGY
jgi:hypothetical protein